MLHLMFGKNVQLNAKQKVLSYFFKQALFRVIKLLLENYIVPFRKQTLYNDDFFFVTESGALDSSSQIECEQCYKFDTI